MEVDDRRDELKALVNFLERKGPKARKFRLASEINDALNQEKRQIKL